MQSIYKNTSGDDVYTFGWALGPQILNAPAPLPPTDAAISRASLGEYFHTSTTRMTFELLPKTKHRAFKYVSSAAGRGISVGLTNYIRLPTYCTLFKPDPILDIFLSRELLFRYFLFLSFFSSNLPMHSRSLKAFIST